MVTLSQMVAQEFQKDSGYSETDGSWAGREELWDFQNLSPDAKRNGFQSVCNKQNVIHLIEHKAWKQDKLVWDTVYSI